jgi:fucose permease
MDSQDRERLELHALAHALVNRNTSGDDDDDDDDEDFDSPRQSAEGERDDAPEENPRRERWTKLFVLALACTFSIGSHYSQSCIGPLKDILKADLNISDSQISLILGSNLVANTIVPIIAGVLVARFGTLKSSLFATGVLFLGQAINLIAVFRGSVYGMIFGLCLFGYRSLCELELIGERV